MGRFTSSFKPKQHTYVRKDFGLPEDAFLLVVVGLRLTEEISDEFVAMLDSVLSENIQCVIMGEMANYEERAGKMKSSENMCIILDYRKMHWQSILCAIYI